MTLCWPSSSSSRIKNIYELFVRVRFFTPRIRLSISRISNDSGRQYFTATRVRISCSTGLGRVDMHFADTDSFSPTFRVCFLTKWALTTTDTKNVLNNREETTFLKRPWLRRHRRRQDRWREFDGNFRTYFARPHCGTTVTHDGNRERIKRLINNTAVGFGRGSRPSGPDRDTRRTGTCSEPDDLEGRSYFFSNRTSIEFKI